ncbi:FMN-linked oxidoreductase, partial [Aspergillus ellipticus CBS 707.79]
SHANLRTDRYGGSTENRCRFVLEVLEAIISVWGARSVGIKICPADDYNNSTVSYVELTGVYTHLIQELVKRDIGFINLSRRGCDVGRSTDDYFQTSPRPEGKELPLGYDPLHQFGNLVKYPGSRTMLMVNHEYTIEEANELIGNGKIDLVAFARSFIYNPDFMSRARAGVPLATNNRGGAVNYGPYQHPDENNNDWPLAACCN